MTESPAVPIIGSSCTRRAWLLGCLAVRLPAAVRYRRLRSPTAVPLAQVADTWRAASFQARCSGTALRGMLVRTPAGLKAFCLHCPHEICPVNYAEDPRSVRVESGPPPDHPVFVCPCHFSVFDPLTDGERLSGPAHRGLYRFRLVVRRDRVEIREVEEEALP